MLPLFFSFLVVCFCCSEIVFFLRILKQGQTISKISDYFVIGQRYVFGGNIDNKPPI
ncbi:hypothetical protein NC99_32890 [Sunxiuqinia dokdonensis]|uniref:Uncharacterized protein n=1 Tax=Sunxiuqinia dokdonensis TaxID=1409788 RepID=A0A0L8V611_9BACT|nr:hypothetical protein NC99_32890 [Sunxiuqinia dokdonensis]